MTTVSRSELSAGPTPSYEVPPGIMAGPIVPTMLRLALPTTVVLVITNRPLGPTLVDGKGMKIASLPA
ncbi:hypothetical protein [Pelagibacterium limicola]|uniref:hypothetical protein n=1 Tax=Pelagibacterium limicola TaxID=2791022 RepID=UPI0018AF820D|nr:hypothetical protein [Pelagibacterium limicola]